MQQWAEPGMCLHDLLANFDAALDWPPDDPFLADDETRIVTWATVEGAAEVAT